MAAPSRPHHRLIWKYTAVVVLLVAAAIVSVGVTELYFSYEDSKLAVTGVEADKASSAAVSIDQFIQEIVDDLDSVARSPVDPDPLERIQDFRGLLARQKLLSELTYLDANGRECVRAYSFEINRLETWECGGDRSTSPEFMRTRAEQRYFGDVAFDDRDARPHMTVAVAEHAPGQGVIVADVDLRSVVDAIDRARIGDAGYAYAVNANGEVIAHPDINLVLAHTNFSALPQVRAALTGAATARADVVTTGRDQDGREVLSAFQRVDPPGWWVFVEEPLSEAFAPIESAIWRTMALLVVFLLVAIATSVLLARNLVRPIESIQTAAARIGSGALDQRIEISSRDELGALAEEFNRMAARLQESYAGLEHQVQERTRELTRALSRLDEQTRELEAASHHKSEFLANMSHELRTPLNAISGFSQVLRKGIYGEINEKQAEYLDDVLASARHLLSLIDDVLDLSKVEAGQIELQVVPFSLPAALERGVVMVREGATKGDVRISLSSDLGIDTVIGDERRVRQVIFNLLSNAVKFTPAGGTVDVALARLDGEMRVSVSDTGPGIAPEDQARIFEEFQQAAAGKEQREGTGLGLALSKRLVELHGGRIWVESVPGTGSRFVFTLPAPPT
ncbi:MAG: ATP-binding protein [Candidatus Limnocylindrales bacterium]|nr:ATP-binding protein [Candidatus Limnocylindrales bacterium]